MKLTEEQKKRIEEEYAEFEAEQYAGKTKEERQKLGQFYTPAPLTIQMLEKFDSITKEDTILDPTCGAGGLLAAAIIAGADPKKVFGVELDANIVPIAKKRLSKLGVPDYNIHQGNALNRDCIVFPESEFEELHKGETYKFTDEGEIGKVKYIKKDGTKSITFGLRR